jgi:hypothetical protein
VSIVGNLQDLKFRVELAFLVPSTCLGTKKVQFPGFDDYYEMVKRLDLESDTCTLKFKVATLMLSKMR